MLDVIGIGLGPFNLSLAALLTKSEVSAQFFEQKAEFNWHKGMILPHTTLQVPFMADLVTLIDPTSRYSFLNYLHSQQRLLKFYFLEDFKIYRKEYNHYCQWVVGQLENLSFDAHVLDVSFINGDDGSHQGFSVTVREKGEQKTYQAKNLVVGTGTQPVLPQSLLSIAQQAPERCMHTADFADHFDLDKIKTDSRLAKILVLGSGQSSAEVYRELFEQQFDEHNKPKFQLDWITRSAGFFPMEYSPLGLEHFSPEYTEHFYHLDPAYKAKALSKQDLLYKGMGFETIQEIYHRLYERSIAKQELHSNLLSNTEVVDVTLADTLNVALRQLEQNKLFSSSFDCVIAGTGYRHRLPPCLSPMLQHIQHDEFNQPKISRDYTLEYQSNLINPGNIFVQNQEIHSHGVGAPDLGLGAYRAGNIVNQLAKRQVYDTDALKVFQTFGSPRT